MVTLAQSQRWSVDEVGTIKQLHASTASSHVTVMASTALLAASHTPPVSRNAIPCPTHTHSCHVTQLPHHMQHLWIVPPYPKLRQCCTLTHTANGTSYSTHTAGNQTPAQKRSWELNPTTLIAQCDTSNRLTVTAKASAHAAASPTRAPELGWQTASAAPQQLQCFQPCGGGEVVSRAPGLSIS